jgi:segregation and condensation protein A
MEPVAPDPLASDALASDAPASEARPPEDRDGTSRDGPVYAVKLSVFEGPLDLLLHLIRINEVEITDIPIARIADQYIEYLDLMRELNIDVASDYLVMAATLAWIKSRMLLPPEEGEDTEEGVDPRAELVARLLEYQRFKEVAAELGERTRLGRDVFAAHGAEPERPDESEREIDVGLLQLLEAFRRVLSVARHSGAAHELEVEPISVRDCMIACMDHLGGREFMEFEDLFRGADGQVGSRSLVVGTFLAILELARLGALRIFQSLDDFGAPSGPIRVRAVSGADVDWSAKIAEMM